MPFAGVDVRVSDVSESEFDDPTEAPGHGTEMNLRVRLDRRLPPRLGGVDDVRLRERPRHLRAVQLRPRPDVEGFVIVVVAEAELVAEEAGPKRQSVLEHVAVRGVDPVDPGDHAAQPDGEQERSVDDHRCHQPVRAEPVPKGEHPPALDGHVGIPLEGAVPRQVREPQAGIALRSRSERPHDRPRKELARLRRIRSERPLPEVPHPPVRPGHGVDRSVRPMARRNVRPAPALRSRLGALWNRRLRPPRRITPLQAVAAVRVIGRRDGPVASDECRHNQQQGNDRAPHRPWFHGRLTGSDGADLAAGGPRKHRGTLPAPMSPANPAGEARRRWEGSPSTVRHDLSEPRTRRPTGSVWFHGEHVVYLSSVQESVAPGPASPRRRAALGAALIPAGIILMLAGLAGDLLANTLDPESARDGQLISLLRSEPVAPAAVRRRGRHGDRRHPVGGPTAERDGRTGRRPHGAPAHRDGRARRVGGNADDPGAGRRRLVRSRRSSRSSTTTRTRASGSGGRSPARGRATRRSAGTPTASPVR